MKITDNSLKNYDKAKEFKKVKWVIIICFIALVAIGILNVFYTLNENISFILIALILVLILYYQFKLRQFIKMTGESPDKFDALPASTYNQFKKASKWLLIACFVAGIIVVISIVLVYLFR